LDAFSILEFTMKKSNEIRKAKLSVNRQTLVVLTHRSLGDVQGGVGTTTVTLGAGCEPTSGIRPCQ
jgi:hypothetical protein